VSQANLYLTIQDKINYLILTKKTVDSKISLIYSYFLSNMDIT
jgi:hypothetical protein